MGAPDAERKAVRKGDYANYNQRSIYSRMTGWRALYLSIDALDFKNLNTGAPNPCMKVRCCEFDTALADGEKITGEVQSYIPIGEFLVFCNDVLSGVMSRMKRAATNHAKEPYYKHFGGSISDTITSTRLALVDGLGEDADFAFLATTGQGVKATTGLITPKPGVAPAVSIFINMPNKELKEFCIIGQAYVQQFIALDLQQRLESVRSMREHYVDRKKQDGGVRGGNSA